MAATSLLTAVLYTLNQASIGADTPGTNLLNPSEASNQNGVESAADTQSEGSHFSVTDSATYNRSESSLDSSSAASSQNGNESGGFLRTFDNPRPPGLPSGMPYSIDQSSTSDDAKAASAASSQRSDNVGTAPQHSEYVGDTSSNAKPGDTLPASADHTNGQFQISDYVKSYFQSNRARAARLSGKSQQ